MSHESLSALLDGECTPEELTLLLDEMERSPELKAAYSRLVAIREAQAGTRIIPSQPDLCAGIMARLDEVPADTRANVIPIRRAPAKVAFQWKPLAGLAAAAALGAVAVLVTVPQTRDRDVSGPIAVVPSASTGVIPVSVPMPGIRRHGNLQTVSATAEQLQQDDLNQYLMDHAFADRGSMASTLSSARFAAHTAEYRPEPDAATEAGDQH
jgi:negative regulator of sigma E activity